MSFHQKKQVREILEKVDQKIQLLRTKAQQLANKKEIEAQIQRLEAHKQQIEQELKDLGHRLRARWTDSKPHLQKAIGSLTQALKLLLACSPSDSSSPKKPSSSSSRKSATKRSTPKAS